MAVLIISDVIGQTREDYDSMLDALEPALDDARGFIAHGAGPSRDGWTAFEIWETPADATAFFTAHVRPHLPPGATPQRTVVELHALVLGPLAAALHLSGVETYIPGLMPRIARIQ